MLPLAAVEAGRRAAGGRFAFYLGVQLASVLAPGLVVTAALAVPALHRRHPHALAHYLEGAGARISGPAALLTDVAVVAAAYILGYVSREIAFRAIGTVEQRYGRTEPAPQEILGDLRRTCGESTVADCLRAHPLLEHLLDPRPGGVVPPGGAVAGPVRRVGGGRRDGSVYEAFVYATSWLRAYGPAQSVDTVEAEINILVSTLVPTAVVAGALIAAGPFGPAGSAAVAVLAAAVVGLLLASALRLRRAERWESLRNLVQDHAMRRAAAALQAVPLPRSAGDEPAGAAG